MATTGLEKKGNRYYINIVVKDELGRQRHIHRAGGTRADEAKKLLTKLKAEHNTFRSNTRTSNIFNLFLEYIKNTKKITTYNRYSEMYKKYIHDEVKDISIFKIDERIVNKILEKAQERNISQTTLQSIYQLMNTFFRYAYKKHLILSNPCDFVNRPKRSKTQHTVLTADEVRTLLHYAKKQTQEQNAYQLGNIMFYIALRIEFETGLRRGELTALTFEDIDFDRSEIRIQKNIVYTGGFLYLNSTKTQNSIRTIKISETLKNELKRYEILQIKNRLQFGVNYIIPEYRTHNGNKQNERREIIWRYEDGSAVHPERFRIKLQKYLKELGLKKIRFHDLRHTNATLLYEAGVDFKVISERLGHSDINTTLNIYTSVSSEHQERAVKALENIINI